MSELKDAAGITLRFCALCNESIPQGDVDAARAKHHKDRWICATCERAMSAAPAQAASSPGAPGGPSDSAGPAAPAGAENPAQVPAAPRRESSGGAGILVGTLALVVAAGGLVWTRWQRAEDQRVDQARLARTESDWQGRLDDAQRALAVERAARESLAVGLTAAQGEWRRAADDVRRASADQIARLGAELESLRSTLAALDARLATAVSKTELSALQDEADAARVEVASLAQKLVELEQRERAPEPQAAVDPVVAAQPAWLQLVQKLKSPDFSARWTAVQELGDTRDAAVVAYLVPILQDSDVFVRLATARVLGDLASLEAVDGLIGALGDEHPTVREEAYVSLRKLTKKDLPFDAQSNDTAERQRRIKAWQDWWKKARESGSTP